MLTDRRRNIATLGVIIQVNGRAFVPNAAIFHLHSKHEVNSRLKRQKYWANETTRNLPKMDLHSDS